MTDTLSGLNLGAGNWHGPKGWQGIDRQWGDQPFNLDAGSVLPVADGSLNAVYSSMFFEHIDDATAQHLICEAARVLARDGVLRIVVPDFDLALERYRAGDHAFFDAPVPDGWGLEPRLENWLQHGISLSLENKLLFVFSGYHNKYMPPIPAPWRTDPSYLAGPPIIDRHVVRTAAQRLSGLEFSAWAVAKIPIGIGPECRGHVNAFTTEKLRVMAYRAGFRVAEPSYFRGSRSATMRSDMFDKHPAIALHFEAIR